MRTLQNNRSIPALALVATLAAGAGFLLHESTTAAPAPTARDDVHELSRAFRDVAHHISPSVVSVIAEHGTDRPAQRRLREQLLQDPWHLFGDDAPFEVPTPRMRGQGSGVIVGQDGIIATNNHVVAGADKVEVLLQDGRKLPAEVAGTDPATDLAILRVKEKDLPAAKLGNSKLLEPGDWVVAVGSPFGLDHTVTVGVVSATGRRVGIADPSYEDFIQTDAAINPGNSGGPLLNLDGEVIGINTAIRSSNGGSDGISFAIPSATLENVLPQLVEGGRVSRGWLGVSLQPLDKDLAKSFGAANTHGALVAEVVDGSPAEKAGLHAGDIILSVDDQRMDDTRDVSDKIAALGPNKLVHLRILRDKAEQDIEVTLGERDNDVLARNDAQVQPSTGRFGLRLDDVPAAMSRELGVDGGALVREVEPGSVAEDAGIQPGDVLLSIDGKEVSTANEGTRALRDAEGGVRLLLRSMNGGTRWVYIDREKD